MDRTDHERCETMPTPAALPPRGRDETTGVAQVVARLESFIGSRLNESTYIVIHEVDPRTLLTWNRLDLGLKLVTLNSLASCKEYALEAYGHDIRAQTLGRYVEFGDERKAGLDRYLHEFVSISESIRSNGFDPQQSLIPLASDGSILNGAHRVAAAVHACKTVSVILTKLPPIVCDHTYFLERAVPTDLVYEAAYTLLKWGENSFVAFLWPSGDKHFNETEPLFDRVVVKRSLELTELGGFNLLHELYSHMDWIGDPISGYPGLRQKLFECFPPDRPKRPTVIVFQGDSLQGVKTIKEGVRSICGIGFSSVHITDTKREALGIAGLTLSDNGVHFLNHANPRIYHTVERIQRQVPILGEARSQRDDILFDGSATLELYGARRATDLDAFHDASLVPPAADELDATVFGDRDEQLRYHRTTRGRLMTDHRYWFRFAGAKFVSLEQLARMKRVRAEPKDQFDLVLIESYLARPNGLAKLRATIRYRLTYVRHRVKYKAIEGAKAALTRLGLLDTARRVYRRAFKKAQS